MTHSVTTTRLFQLEAVISGGLKTFVDVGAALLEIRDTKLYREHYRTFEGYCATRWNLTRKRAYDVMTAAEVAGLLSPTGDIPANESQARELAPLRNDPVAMAEAWVEVQERTDGKPTAKAIRAVVRREPTEGQRAMAEGVERIIANDPDLSRRDQVDRLNRVLAAAMRVNTEATAPYWADRLAPDDVEHVRSVMGSLRRWIESWEAALAAQKSLRVVGGRS